MKKVIHIVTQMEGGGAQRCAIEAARRFRTWDVDTEVWFLFRRRGIYDHEPGVHCLWPHDPESPLAYFKIIRLLYKKLLKERPDAIITHSHYANILGGFFSFLAHIPIRVACQTGLPNRVPKIAQVLDRVWGHLGVYTKIIANSKTNYNAFKNCRSNRYVKRMIQVSNGVLPLPKSDEGPALRHSLAIEKTVHVLGCIGRLAKVKNHSLLFHSIAKLPNTALLLAGDGEEKETLTQLALDLKISNRIFFLGDLHIAELATMCAACDIFVHPSLWESFGLVPLEAASTGLPLVVSDLEALREVLGTADEANALFFEPNNLSSLIQTLSLLLDDPNAQARLSKRSLSLAKNFSLEKMSKGYLDAIGGA